MQNVLNPMVTMYQTQLEASRRFADAIFSGTEKIDRVVIGATHRVFTEQLRFAQTLSTIRDPRSVGNALQSSFFSRNPDDAVNYQKEIMRIFAEMQNELGRSLQDYIEQLGTNAATSAAAPLEAVQERANDAVFNPMTSMFSVWETAFKEVAALAKKNMMAARSTAEEAAAKAAEAVDTYTSTASAPIHEAATVADTAVSSASAAAKSTVPVSEEGGTEEKRATPAAAPVTTTPVTATPVTTTGGSKRK